MQQFMIETLGGNFKIFHSVPDIIMCTPRPQPNKAKKKRRTLSLVAPAIFLGFFTSQLQQTQPFIPPYTVLPAV